MAIQQNFPDEGPTLNLNFAGSRTLDPRITFTRTSSATYTGPDGLIKIAPVNSPRFDHSYNSATGEIESLGLLIEEARTNLLLRSEEFDNASWIRLQSSISANVIAAPNGTVTADKLIEDSSNDTHSAYVFPSGLTATLSYTISIYAKAAERTAFAIDFRAIGSGFRSVFNLAAGTASGSAVGSGTFISTSIQAVGDGWYRCSVTGSHPTDTSINLNFRLNNPAGTDSYTGDGTSGIYIWGAQLEAGSFPTSYIPTTASTVTRTVDSVSMTGTNFSSWYNQSEGTFFTSFKQNYNSSATVPGKTSHVLQAGNATTINDNYTIRAGDTTTNYPAGLVRSASPSSIQFPGFGGFGFLNSSTQYKLALSVNISLISISANGLLSADIVNITTINHTTQFNKLFIGSGTGGGPPYELAGTISQLTYYPKRLSNAQLQTLTR